VQQRTVVWLIILRVVVITTLLFTALMFQSVTEFTHTLSPFFYLTALTYALTITYIILLKLIPSILNVYAQLCGDVLIITTIVYYSGGLESSFSFLYIIIIIIASTLLYRRGGMVIASASAIAYGAMIDLQYYGFLTFLPFSEEAPVWSQGKIYYNLFINIIGFFGAALLTSIISEKLRRTTEVLSATASHLHDLQVFQHSVLSSITSPLIITNELGIVQYMNTGARAMFPDMSDITSLGLVTLEQLQEYVPDQILPVNQAFHHRGRVYIPGVSSFSSSDESTAGFIFILDDITELQKLEAELRRQEHIAAIGTMAAAIAHEIRNPLATITGSVQMLEGESREEANTHLFRIILDESRRLNRFIENFIRFVKSPEPTIEILDLRQQIIELIQLLGSNQDWKKIQLNLEAPDRSIFIYGDRDRIQQIFWNLLTNASKALGHEGGTVNISIQPDGKKVRITVRDTGSGIPPEERERIFEPFHGSFTKGLGLGLTLVKRYVEESRGSISLGESSDSGTSFILQFENAEPPHA